MLFLTKFNLIKYKFILFLIKFNLIKYKLNFNFNFSADNIYLHVQMV